MKMGTYIWILTRKQEEQTVFNVQIEMYSIQIHMRKYSYVGYKNN